MFESADAHTYAAIVLAVTRVTNTLMTWPHLKHWSMEFSQMGWGSPGAAGGYYVMACGLNVFAAILFRVHVIERCYMGALCAVLSRC